MKANTFTGKNGQQYLDSSNPYTGENETEKAMVYLFHSVLVDIGVVSSTICDDDNEERTVFDRIDDLESKLDIILDELRLARTAREAL